MRTALCYETVHYEKTSPFLWLYDKLFPLPAVCPVCMKPQNKLQVCESCRMEALRVRSLHGQCQKCHSFGIYSDGCSNCRAWPGYLAGNRSIWLYRDAWKEVIRDFKFRNKPWLADALAGELLPYIPDGYDLLVPVPLHINRLRERGYNQSELLVRALSRQSGIPWQHSLQRVRDTPHQTGRNRAERLENLRDAFVCTKDAAVAGKRILLVDDVFTTGTTLLTCANVLHEHGAMQIMGLTLASGQGSH